MRYHDSRVLREIRHLSLLELEGILSRPVNPTKVRSRMQTVAEGRSIFSAHREDATMLCKVCIGYALRA